jgi:hypothetical protein
MCFSLCTNAAPCAKRELSGSCASSRFSRFLSHNSKSKENRWIENTWYQSHVHIGDSNEFKIYIELTSATKRSCQVPECNYGLHAQPCSTHKFGSSSSRIIRNFNAGRRMIHLDKIL